METFRAAVGLAENYQQHLTIGGGEPTMHPLLREFVGYATWEMAGLTAESGIPAVHMVTNGSNTEMALTIASLAKSGVITAAVSRDQYHDPIDDRVYRAFEKAPSTPYSQRKENDHDHRSVNKGNGIIIPVGRAKSWGNHAFVKCACDALFVNPKGNIYSCGCRTKLIGNIHDNPTIGYEDFEGLCGKSEDYKKRKAELAAELSR
jgi:MoaA/NifB/PqqE/SkfB family radical SAM enzyme